MNWTLYASFIGASLVVLALPGPSFAYALAVAARSSRREIFANAIGMGAGGLFITAALALGLAVLVATVPLVYTALQWAGCAYLVMLGLRALRAAPPAAGAAPEAARRSTAQAFWQGFFVETANPKAILFYSAMVPQFVDIAQGHVALQTVLLGGTFVALQVLWDLGLMFGAAHLRDLAGPAVSPLRRQLGRWFSGMTYIALGVSLLAFGRPKTAGT